MNLTIPGINISLTTPQENEELNSWFSQVEGSTTPSPSITNAIAISIQDMDKPSQDLKINNVNPENI